MGWRNANFTLEAEIQRQLENIMMIEELERNCMFDQDSQSDFDSFEEEDKNA